MVTIAFRKATRPLLSFLSLLAHRFECRHWAKKLGSGVPRVVIRTKLAGPRCFRLIAFEPSIPFRTSKYKRNRRTHAHGSHIRLCEIVSASVKCVMLYFSCSTESCNIQQMRVTISVHEFLGIFPQLQDDYFVDNKRKRINLLKLILHILQETCLPFQYKEEI